MELEDVYRRYSIRLKHSLFLASLIIAFLSCGSLLGAVIIFSEVGVYLRKKLQYDVNNKRRNTLIFQTLASSFELIIELICLSLFFLAILAISQLPTVLGSERVASIVSVTTVIIFAGCLIRISSTKCPALMFALLLAVHAMLPISRLTSFIISGPLLTIYLIIFAFDDSPPDTVWQLLREVSRLNWDKDKAMHEVCQNN